MEINSQILNYLLPNQSVDLFKFLKSLEETPSRKSLTFKVNDQDEIVIEFDKRMLLDVQIEIPLWVTLIHNAAPNELNLRVIEREKLIHTEQKFIKEFKEKNSTIFSSYGINGNIDKRNYSFTYDPACNCVLWKNDEIIEIQNYIFRYLKLVAA